MEALAYEVFETDWGWTAVAGSRLGIRFATLPEATPPAALEGLAGLLRGGRAEQARLAPFEDFRQQVCRYLRGDQVRWSVPLDWSGAPPFFQQAWNACQTIPRGETRSYGWLAAQAGRPDAARAAGQAMARNWVPLVVPCHRVVGSDGALVGFGGHGVALKERLLALERPLTAS